jgi:hypothetical protein
VIASGCSNQSIGIVHFFLPEQPSFCPSSGL